MRWFGATFGVENRRFFAQKSCVPFFYCRLRPLWNGPLWNGRERGPTSKLADRLIIVAGSEPLPGPNGASGAVAGVDVFRDETDTSVGQCELSSAGMQTAERVLMRCVNPRQIRSLGRQEIAVGIEVIRRTSPHGSPVPEIVPLAEQQRVARPVRNVGDADAAVLVHGSVSTGIGKPASHDADII